MTVSPNHSPDYQEFLDSYSQNTKVSLDVILEKFQGRSYAVIVEKPEHKLLYSAFLLNLQVFQRIPEDLQPDSSIVFLFQMVLYDYYDLLQAFIHCRGLQVFSVARSFMEHTRVFLLSCLDQTFLRKYETDPHYIPKPENITQALKKIVKEAKREQSKEEHSVFYLETALSNLNMQRYLDVTEDKTLYQQLSQITHFGKTNAARKMFGNISRFDILRSKAPAYGKYLDTILEYAISTTLITALIFHMEGVSLSYESVQMYNLLNYMEEHLLAFRQCGDILWLLKERAKQKYHEPIKEELRRIKQESEDVTSNSDTTLKSLESENDEC